MPTVFLSYSSAQSVVAERIELSLKGEGHAVFRDRSTLPPGETFDAHIRAAIDASDLFVFLLSPEAVSGGRYTLTELKFAERKWGHPRGYVLPVMVETTPINSVPAFLRAVTILEPKGDVVAEVSAEIARMAAPWWRWFLRPTGFAFLVTIALLLAAGIWAGAGYWTKTSQVTELLKQAQLHAGAGSYSDAWKILDNASTTLPESAGVIDAQERLAMDWLDYVYRARATASLKDLAETVTPVLARGAARDKGQRSADMLAHLGWAEYLRSSPGARRPETAQHYNRALQIDPSNVYAHSMWAVEILLKLGSLSEAKEHFSIALKAATNRDYVRRMQIFALLGRNNEAFQEEAIKVVNEMRSQGEKLPPGHSNWSPRWDLWNIYYNRLVNGSAKSQFLLALPPAEHVATLRWLYPEDQLPKDKQQLRLYMLAQFQENNSEHSAALASYKELAGELEGKGYGGRMLDGAKSAIKRLAGH